MVSGDPSVAFLRNVGPFDQNRLGCNLITFILHTIKPHSIIITVDYLLYNISSQYRGITYQKWIILFLLGYSEPP